MLINGLYQRKARQSDYKRQKHGRNITQMYADDNYKKSFMKNDLIYVMLQINQMSRFVSFLFFSFSFFLLFRATPTAHVSSQARGLEL